LLPPTGPRSGAAGVNPVYAMYLKEPDGMFWGRFAAQREQAPSPQNPLP
jgi:hypothetical protein